MELGIFNQARKHATRIALRCGDQDFTYNQLLEKSERVAHHLLSSTRDLSSTSDLDEARVGFLVPAGADYVAVQWGIWRAGGVCVPLSLSAARPELEYTLTDSQVSCVVAAPHLLERLEALCQQLGLQLTSTNKLSFDNSNMEAIELPTITQKRRAMILYTSGTTNKPKGVVSTHANIESQIQTLVKAWQWEQNDRIPLFLPLHHIHGIINILCCGLWAGATVETHEQFNLEKIVQQVAKKSYSIFMAVPTIYFKLIQALNALSDLQRKPITDGFATMRLMVSGSAALPASVHEQWKNLTGQELLERYGMTEIGMALSNRYNGERRPGAVGEPLPGVEVRLVDDQGNVVDKEETPGEIQVRGPCVFEQYWRKPSATENSFVNGWFRTGDIAVVQLGYFRIMGRNSVDIIKSGGYKLSALEIEASLLEHPDISECAVVGIPDETWGESVAAAVVLNAEASLELSSLREWSKHRLSKYKIPKHLLVLKSLPRNAMGKITKPAISKLLEPKTS